MKVIYSIGHSNRSIDEFLHLLKKYEIKIVVDVRRFPTSKFDWFRKENLQNFLKKANIEYKHFVELGGYRGGYEKYMQTSGWLEAFEKLERLALKGRVAIMCAEKFYWRCHRRYISNALSDAGWAVKHIVNDVMETICFKK